MSAPESQAESGKAPRISDAEWVVMRVLWRLGEAGASEIYGELKDESAWSPKTVQTLVRRLVQKGAVEFDGPARERVYRPAIDELTCKLQASESFLDRVFDGKIAPFLANFAGRRGGLSEGDLSELKKLLEEADDE